MMENIYTLIIVCTGGFFAAFVDSIAGGGGLISIPVLFLTGMPTHLVLGTNKFAASSGAISSVYNYYKSGNIIKKIVLPLIPLSFIGSFIGVMVVLALNPTFLKTLIIILVVVIGIYTLFNKNTGLVDKYKEPNKRQIFQGQGIALVIGFYDGFFGPGTGSFLIFSIIHIFKVGFKRAAANGKMLNMISNLSALILFFINGQVSFKYGIPMALFMILGAKIGTQFAVKKGSKFIKIIFLIVSFILVGKMTIEMLL